MELPEWLRRFLVGVFFIAASFFLYLGFAIWLLTPGGYHESAVEQLMPLVFILVSLLLVWGIARMLRKPDSGSVKGQDRSRFPVILGATLLGAVLISLIIWRQHWVALFLSR
jgi:hypothetical protein